MTLDAIAELGLEFRRLGWKKHLRHARDLYAATKAGKSAAWSLEHAERLRAVLGQGPSALPVGTHCPAVPAASAGHMVRHAHRAAPRGRYLVQFAKCGAEWVAMVAGAAP